MPNIKKFIQPWSETGKTVYGIIRREADSHLLDNSTGVFADTSATSYIPFTEHVVIKGQYELLESRSVWNDGRYTATTYKQSGGSPSPIADTIIGAGDIYTVNDIEIVIDASISTRAIESTVAKETTVNTRLASSSYVVPDNSSIILVKAKTDTINWSDVTSRLATVDYVVPDNSSIISVKAKTDTINWLDIDRLLGLTLENSVEDDIIRDGSGNKISSVIYLYNSAANATTHDKVTGIVEKYNVTASYSAGKLTLFKVIKV